MRDERALTPDALAARLSELAPWHFDLEIAPGVRTAAYNREDYADKDHRGVGVLDPFELTVILEKVYPEGLVGRSFLDVGCNSGGYCFVAKALGAGETLGFDVRQHWIDQALFLRENWPGDTTGMDFRVAHLDEVDVGAGFDITMFKGVFYHLPDPIGALLGLCGVTRELMVVDTASRSDIPENALVSNLESRTHLMSGVDGFAWLPGGPRAVIDILVQAGFGETRTVYWDKNVEGSLENWGRFRVVAARVPEMFAAV